MSKIRLKYEKRQSVRFVSHLDFVRMMTRALRRAHLPISYSQGFNPHPVMTVAVPLSVGICSTCEYMDMKFDGDDIDVKEVIECFNKNLPEGFYVSEIKLPEQDNLADFKYIDMAEYEIEADILEGTVFRADELMEKEEILVLKKTKKGESMADIKPLIYGLTVLACSHGKLKLLAKLPVGQTSLKPQLIITAINKHIEGFRAEYVSATRTSLIGSEKLCF